MIGLVACYLGFNFQRICTPDLDVDIGFYGFYLVRKFNRIFGWLWEIYWKPYSLIVPHRSWISHFPFVSTTIRLVYSFWPTILLIYFQIPIFYYWDWWLYFYIGMALADGGHILLDYFLPFRHWYESTIDKVHKYSIIITSRGVHL